jgi:hypothetical protein
MRYYEIIREDLTLWHGGRDLESSYDEVRPHKGGHLEHGPGLYLTTHYETAAKYAKGGGKLYKVTVGDGTNISNVVIPLDDMLGFVRRYVIGSKRRAMEEDLRANMNRAKTDGVRAEVLINLCLNHEAIQNTKTGILRQFLIDHGVDYAKVSRYGGRDENLLVVINPKIIRKVEIIPASNVKDGFKLPFFEPDNH